MPAEAQHDRIVRVGRSARGRIGFVALVCFGLFALDAEAYALKIPIQASLTGAGEVPANGSAARGLMQGIFDTDSNTLEWTVTYSGLSSPPIGAHFHGPVSYLGLTPEENAPIQVGTPGSLSSPFHGVAKIDDAQAKDLKDGRWYFNLHSKTFPAGEIRGPVVRR
jgi:CHRD domain-containing protein